MEPEIIEQPAEPVIIELTPEEKASIKKERKRISNQKTYLMRKEKALPKLHCDACDCDYTYQAKYRHLQSKKHLRNINN